MSAPLCFILQLAGRGSVLKDDVFRSNEADSTPDAATIGAAISE